MGQSIDIASSIITKSAIDNRQARLPNSNSVFPSLLSPSNSPRSDLSKTSISYRVDRNVMLCEFLSTLPLRTDTPSYDTWLRGNSVIVIVNVIINPAGCHPYARLLYQMHHDTTGIAASGVVLGTYVQLLGIQHPCGVATVRTTLTGLRPCSPAIWTWHLHIGIG
jgi:hypothetical protein